MLIGGGLSCTSTGPAPWANFPCVLGLLPLRKVALPTIHPSLQDLSAERGPVRHSEAGCLQHGPKVDSSPCHWRCCAAPTTTNEPCVRESLETLEYHVVSGLTSNSSVHCSQWTAWRCLCTVWSANFLEMLVFCAVSRLTSNTSVLCSQQTAWKC